VVALYAAQLMPGEELVHRLPPNRHAWVQVARGAVTHTGLPLQAGDGAAVSQEEELHFGATETSEILLFDLA
jgi:redox-sensitive bicupin YhaK (pirin superfamily)